MRVPVDNLIGEPGGGFAIAQARLGPGRIHHCMRSIGVAERAVELMCARAQERVAFGRPLSDQGVVRDWIAESRVRIEQLRLLVLKTAWLMDTVGNKGAHTEIQAIKIATPLTVQWILDKAIQVHGAGGLSQDFPLANAYASIRTLRLADGPDEVHKNALAKAELRRRVDEARWHLSPREPRSRALVDPLVATSGRGRARTRADPPEWYALVPGLLMVAFGVGLAQVGARPRPGRRPAHVVGATGRSRDQHRPRASRR